MSDKNKPQPDEKDIFWGKTATRKAVTLKRMTFAAFARLMQTANDRMVHTVDQYHALSKPDKGAAKDNRYWTPCSFSKPERALANANKIQLIALDIDGGTFAKTINPDHMHYLTDFDGLPFSWILHSTTGHTIENPRYRLIVDADGYLDPIHYSSTVLTLSKLVGLDSALVTTESKVVCQAMYIPKLPVDAEYIFASNTMGREFTFADIDQTIPTVTATNRHSVDTLDDDPLEMACLQEQDDDKILSALSAIDPNCTRPEWLTICQALRHNYSADPERGFEIFHEWSREASAEKYHGEADCRKQWHNEKPNPKGKNAVKIGSLFHMAKEAGWSLRAVVKSSPTMEHLPDLHGKSVTDIFDTLCPELSEKQMPLYEREVANKAIFAHAKTLGCDIPLATIRKATRYKPKKEHYGWLKDWVFIEASKPYYLHKRMNRPPLPRQGFNDVHNHKCPADSEGRKLTAHDAHRIHLPEQYAVKTAYIPGKPFGIIQTDGARIYNTYRHTRLESSQDNMDDATRLLHQLINNTTDDAQERQLVWDFISHLIQQPQKRINWALLIQGTPGTGKQMLWKLLRLLNGIDNSHMIDGMTLLDNWSDYYGKKTFLFVDEVYAAGNDRFKINNILKPLIGNDYVLNKTKFESPEMVPNPTSIIMTTNHRDALPLEQDDRRVAMVFSHLTPDELKSPTMIAFFTEFTNRLDELAPTYLHILKNRKISSDFKPFGHAPVTVSKLKMAVMAKPMSTGAVEEAIEVGSAGITVDALSFKSLTDLLESSHPGQFNRNALRKALIELQYEQYMVNGKPYRYDHGGVKHPVWIRHAFRKDPYRVLKASFEIDDFDF